MTIITKKVTKRPTKAQLEEAYKPWGVPAKQPVAKKTKKK